MLSKLLIVRLLGLGDALHALLRQRVHASELQALLSHLIVDPRHEAGVHGCVLPFRVDGIGRELELGGSAMDVMLGQADRSAARRRRRGRGRYDVSWFTSILRCPREVFRIAQVWERHNKRRLNADRVAFCGILVDS